jgi:hypothetical protein
MEPPPENAESPPGTSPEAPPETGPQSTPDRKKWAFIGSIAVFAVIVIAAVFFPGLLAKPQQGEGYPISGTPLATTIAEPAEWTPGTAVTSALENTTPTPSGPPGFTVTISPTAATGAKGETVIYHMTIEAQNGFSENISMQLDATALFVIRRTVDLGVQEPPYPKTIDYPFPIPADWPSGVTIDGVVTSTGGGITREDRLSLTVK